MTPNEFADYITKLANKEHNYNTICVDVMLEARKVFTEAAGYGMSDAQAVQEKLS